MALQKKITNPRYWQIKYNNMSSLQLIGEKGNSLLTLASNLKLSLVSVIYQPKLSVSLSENESSLSLIDKKSGFELSEPNAIVKYLANDFNKDKLLEFEETSLYKAAKSNKKDAIVQAINESSIKLEKAETSASQIILFAAVYGALSDGKYETSIDKWFK